MKGNKDVLYDGELKKQNRMLTETKILKPSEKE